MSAKEGEEQWDKKGGKYVNVICEWPLIIQKLDWHIFPYFQRNHPLPLWLTSLLNSAFQLNLIYHETHSWCKCSLWMTHNNDLE